MCVEYRRPRIVYCQKKLTHEQERQLGCLRESFSYSCGQAFHSNDMYVNKNLTCGDPVESSYYRKKLETSFVMLAVNKLQTRKQS